MLVSVKSKGTIQMVAAMMLSGSIGYFVIESAQPFWNVVFFRCLIGAIFLAAYVTVTSQFKWEMFNYVTTFIIVLGGVALVGNWVLLFASFDYIPFSIATIAYHMQPIMLVLAGTVLARQWPSANVILGLVTALVGLWLIVGLDGSQFTAAFSEQGTSSQIIKGVLLALGAAVLYTITTLLTKKVSHIPPSTIAFVQVLIGTIFMFPWADFSVLSTEVTPWINILILGLVNTGFMYVIMYDAFQKLSTPLIAILSFIYPVMALVVDYLAFGHMISFSQVWGIVLILLAVGLVKFNWNFTKFKRRKLCN